MGSARRAGDGRPAHADARDLGGGLLGPESRPVLLENGERVLERRAGRSALAAPALDLALYQERPRALERHRADRREKRTSVLGADNRGG